MTETPQQERTRLLAARWESLAPELKTKTQLIGKTAVACGATHHVMERCNFSCTCCYLGADANKTEPLPFEDVAKQLDAIREHLGDGGKTQITAGEVTLLPLEELGRIVRYALEIGLDPMVMTHGQRFLDEPEYLIALVRDYGLSKVSIHVDTTQRGRHGCDSRMSEADLHRVRDAFAQLIRRVRRETGLPFEAASTVTVTQGNLESMHAVVEWFLSNCDAFRMLSFQPVADVGRTRKHQSAVEVQNEALWEEVTSACGRVLNATPMHFGHPKCNTTVPMVIARVGRERVIFEAIREKSDADESIFQAAVETIGPAMDWTRSIVGNLPALLKIMYSKPRFTLGVMNYSIRRVWDERQRILKLIGLSVYQLKLPKVKPFILVVHNFMSPGEMDTEVGKARLEACVFKVPVDGQMISMCEMNASGLRAKIDQMQLKRPKVVESAPDRLAPSRIRESRLHTPTPEPGPVPFAEL
ncbi:MAG: radical SAM protein [Verrucomicrobiota bacterium]